MKIVCTPMCESLLKLAGLDDYIVNLKVDNEKKADYAISLSETKVNMPCLQVKMNTFDQYYKSVVSIWELAKENKLNCVEDIQKVLEKQLSNERISSIWCNYIWTLEDSSLRHYASNICYHVKVYSNFLKETVQDMGFNILDDGDDEASFVIVPDYLKDTITDDGCVLSIPSHKNVSLDAFERLCERYTLISDFMGKQNILIV